MTQAKVALDAALQRMFRDLEARGAPEHIVAVVDQLEANAAAGLPLNAAIDAVTPSPEPPSSPTP